MNSEEDTELGTMMLIEEYEYQANIMVGGSEGGKQLASNKLFRLRKDMHAKIHYLLHLRFVSAGAESAVRCEFCFEGTKESEIIWSSLEKDKIREIVSKEDLSTSRKLELVERVLSGEDQ